MTIEKRVAVEEAFTLERRAMKEIKMNSYAGKNTDDAYANFKKRGERQKMSKYKVWQTYAGKHQDSIDNAINDNPDRPEDASENIAGRIKDIMNYYEILYGMLVEDGIIADPTVAFEENSIRVVTGTLEAMQIGPMEFDKVAIPRASLVSRTDRLSSNASPWGKGQLEVGTDSTTNEC